MSREPVSLADAPLAQMFSSGLTAKQIAYDLGEPAFRVYRVASERGIPVRADPSAPYLAALADGPLTATEIAQKLGVTYRSARHNLRLLEKRGGAVKDGQANLGLFCKAAWRYRATGLPLAPMHYGPRKVAAPCSQPGCGRPFEARGLCALHYRRMLRGADLEAPPGLRTDEALIERIREAAPGRTYKEIGKIVSLSKGTVYKICKRHGIAPGRAWKPSKVPAWVPPRLVDGFLARMRKRGQIEAAAWARAEIARAAP